MRHKDLYDIACRMFDDAKCEAEWRIIAHAAYYAVYHLACETFAKDPTLYKDARHENIAVLCETQAVAAIAAPWRHSLRKAFRKMLSLRVWADYDHRTGFAQTQAQAALDLADSVFERVQ